MKRICILSFGLLVGQMGMGAIAPFPVLAQRVHPPNTSEPNPTLLSPNILFRTKHYVGQIIWRRGIPYMTVSNNGTRILADVRAQVLPARGEADSWTTYSAQLGDYTAYIRVSPEGMATLAIQLKNQHIVEEYATARLPAVQQSPPMQPSDGTVLAFETGEYAVHIFRRHGKLVMNLYNQKTRTTDLQQVPVTLVNMSDGLVYRYDGAATIQAREDVKGRRSLLIIRDNAIQYRGEAL